MSMATWTTVSKLRLMSKWMGVHGSSGVYPSNDVPEVNFPPHQSHEVIIICAANQRPYTLSMAADVYRIIEVVTGTGRAGGARERCAGTYDATHFTASRRSFYLLSTYFKTNLETFNLPQIPINLHPYAPSLATLEAGVKWVFNKPCLSLTMTWDEC